MSCAASYVTARCRYAPSINDAPLRRFDTGTLSRAQSEHETLESEHSATRLRFHGIIDRRHPGAGPVFAPTVHGSAWPNGPLGQTLRITAFQCQAFRCDQALRWNTITSFAAVEHKSLRQHRYGGVGNHGFCRAGSINELRPLCFAPSPLFCPNY